MASGVPSSVCIPWKSAGRGAGGWQVLAQLLLSHEASWALRVGRITPKSQDSQGLSQVLSGNGSLAMSDGEISLAVLALPPRLPVRCLEHSSHLNRSSQGQADPLLARKFLGHLPVPRHPPPCIRPLGLPVACGLAIVRGKAISSVPRPCEGPHPSRLSPLTPLISPLLPLPTTLHGSHFPPDQRLCPP